MWRLRQSVRIFWFIFSSKCQNPIKMYISWIFCLTIFPAIFQMYIQVGRQQTRVSDYFFYLQSFQSARIPLKCIFIGFFCFTFFTGYILRGIYWSLDKNYLRQRGHFWYIVSSKCYNLFKCIFLGFLSYFLPVIFQIY